MAHSSRAEPGHFSRALKPKDFGMRMKEKFEAAGGGKNKKPVTYKGIGLTFSREKPGQ